MELYSLYNAFIILFEEFFEWAFMDTILWSVIACGAAFAILFILQGLGLYKMAKNRGISHKWLAFVPFANVMYMGKLAGTCYVFGQKMKRTGLYAMIAQIITLILCFLAAIAEIYLITTNGTPAGFDDMGVPFWASLQGPSATIYKFYGVSSYIISIPQLIYEILLFILLLSLYKQYTPRNYFALGILTLFIPLSRYIIAFVLRKRAPINYEAYMRARRDAYARQQQYRNGYGNPYGNPYGNNHSQNPYGSPEQTSAPRYTPEDPFAEFSIDNAAKNDDPFAVDDDTKDGEEKDDLFD